MAHVDSAGVPRVRSLGRYELFAKLGSGGMAEVHLARQRGLKRFRKLVVVKTVHPQLAKDERFVDLLLDEARISALLKHPRVVDIYDVDEDDGTVFIAMEYLPGQSLNEIIKAGRRGNKLGILPSARIIADAAEGLDAAHNLRSHSGDELELVHRDVSPGNIVVLYGGEVKLVDFGVAKARDHLNSGISKFAGKLGYAAPEQLDSDNADRRSDVFSLGVVFWELLCLRRLFSSKTRDQALEMVSSGKAPKPSSIREGVPEAIDEICLRATRPDPADRFQSAKEMREAINAALLDLDFRENDAVANYMDDVFAGERADTEALVRRISEGTSQISIAELRAEDAATTIDESLPEKIAQLEDELAQLTPVTPAAGTPPAGPALSQRMTAVFRSGHPWRRPLGLGAAAVGVVLFAFLIIEFSTSGTSAESHSSAPSTAASQASASAGRSLSTAAGSADAAAAGDPTETDASVGTKEGTGAGETARRETTTAEENLAEKNLAEKKRAEEKRAEEKRAEEKRAAEKLEAEKRAEEKRAEEKRAEEKRAEEKRAEEKPAADRVLAKSRYLEGTRAIRRGDMSAARAKLTSAIAADPGYALAYRGLGVVHQASGNKKAAAREFRRYLKLHPKARDADRIRKTIAKLEGK